jgi:hypothetical protein
MPEADRRLINHDAGLSAGSRNPKIGEDLAADMARAFLYLLFFLPFPFFLIDTTFRSDEDDLRKAALDSQL